MFRAVVSLRQSSISYLLGLCPSSSQILLQWRVADRGDEFFVLEVRKERVLRFL